MEHEFTELLSELKKQNETLKKQLFFSKICALAACFVIVGGLLTSVLIFPRISSTLDTADHLVQELDHLASDISEADLPSVLQNMDQFMTTSQDSMTEATAKLQALDIESLNQAIHDLNSVVSPLAKLFNR